jgi:general secretion pathway protein K
MNSPKKSKCGGALRGLSEERWRSRAAATLCSSSRGRQCGAALLTAMIIVALIATLAASMIWQQWRAVQVEAAERSRTQSAWILSGALDWARLILREDARNGGADYLGEPWAVPLAEARLSTFLAADKSNTDDGPDAFLSGAITDAQARYNLTNLVNGGRVDPVEMDKLQRLCETIGVSADVATSIANGLRDASPIMPPAPAPAAAASGVPAASAPAPAAAPAPEPPANPPLLPRSVAQLNWFGIAPDALLALEPYVVILPVPTPVNVNTAPREVLVAAIPGLDLATAERIVQSRQRVPIKSSGDAQALAPAVPAASFTFSPTGVSASSDFFEVRGRLRLADVVLEQRSLVQRRGIDVIVIQRERVASRDPSGN